MSQQPANRQWSTQFAFLAAAIGSAVGISNIWKFTYVAGENGGGLFIAVYLLALVVISIPALVAELLIGRAGGRSVVGTMQVLAEREGISRHWRWYGLMAALGVFLALSFYCVVAGWTLFYFTESLGPSLNQLSAESSAAFFNDFLSRPGLMMFFQAAFLVLTAIVVAGGIKGGLERVLRWLTPGLFVILIGLVIYAAIAGDFLAALKFMFIPSAEDFHVNVILVAVGQAFFSLGVGLGVLMTVGAYMKKEFSVSRAALIIATADGGVAILAGLAIFPIVFQYGLSPAGGPGLIFTTLPIAFSQMPGGAIIGPLFFLLLAMAAFTSSVTLLEAVVAWLEEVTPIRRRYLAMWTAMALWVVGLATVFSFNWWADFKPLAAFSPFQDKTVFELIDYLVSNIMMPLGGIFVAVIAGWALTRDRVEKELNLNSPFLFQLWYLLVRFLVPLAVTAVFFMNLV